MSLLDPKVCEVCRTSEKVKYDAELKRWICDFHWSCTPIPIPREWKPKPKPNSGDCPGK